MSARPDAATGAVPQRVPVRVGVLGGGRMGAGIAHAFALAGSTVTVVERDETSAEGARARIERALSASIERGATGSSLEELSARVTVGTDLALFAGHALVIEAVPESLELKLEALARLEAVTDAGTVLASNTSSISITRLARGLTRPEQLCGLHFFNPVPASKLIEVVVGEHTARAVVVAAQGWSTALGKTPITVRDAPGFASSRLGVALALEAVRMLEDGVASAEDIDAAMVLGYGHPIGPLALTDLVGLDVRLDIADYLHATLGDRFSAPELLRELVARGDLGRKTGRGFYDYAKENQT